MAAPTTPATSLEATIVLSNGFRINFTKGDGLRRLVAVTKGSDSVKHPIDGVGYTGSLKLGEGDPLVSLTSGSGSCYPYYPYPDPVDPVSSNSDTYVVYEGMNEGIVGIDVINLKPQSTYQVVVYEHSYYCYIASTVLTVVTGYSTNTEGFGIHVYDNRTRLPIENADIAFLNVRQFVSDFGTTNNIGKYNSLSMEEGRYEMSVVAANYDSKILTGLFVQREEPRRDNNYRQFTSAGNTEIGSSVTRNYYSNKNDYEVYLDPINTTAHSFNRYRASSNPSNTTKL
tara:strand:+ start:73542 stop:74396 length:855 start_codon:yes stop_codon:yes gene_type:complete